MTTYAISPALWQGEAGSNGAERSPAGAYELKCPVGLEVAEALLDAAQLALTWDPHCGADSSCNSQGGGYGISSLYLDTADLSVFCRQPGYARKKFRIRRYGDAGEVFLEKKVKRRGVVRKQRTVVPLAELGRLDSRSDGGDGPATWFRERLIRRQLCPTVQIRYQRHALIGESSGGPIRLTVDRSLHWRIASDYLSWVGMGSWDGGNPSAASGELFEGMAIVEFKFCNELPPVFRQLMEQFRLTPQACSKYRRAVESSCLPTARKVGQGLLVFEE